MDTGTQTRGTGTALTTLGIGGKLAHPAFRFDGSGRPLALGGAQKAAVIVQMILDAGGTVPLSVMSEATQVHLARVFASMGPINKATVAAVLDEFSTHLDAHGLSFPRDTSAALDALQGNLSDSLLEQMRQIHSPTLPKNTWETIADLPPQVLADRLSSESARVGAIIMSKLPENTATDVLELLDDETANAITFAISETESVHSTTVDVVAQALLDSSSGTRLQGAAFATPPVARAAALLNAAGNAQRDTVLEALEKLDEAFAAQVRKAIFTFADIVTRLNGPDVAQISRVMPSDEMHAALKAGETEFPDVVAFIFENMSKRMADQIREELSEMAPLTGKSAEAAMGKMTTAIRDLADAGDIALISLPEEDGAT